MASALQVKEVIPLSAMRRIIGRRMSESKQTAPHFYVSVDVDMGEVERGRKKAKEEGRDPVPTINDFVLQACAKALRDFFLLNTSLTDEGIAVYSDINLGMVVALEEGLVVPVIRNADRLTLEELTARSRELVEKAQRKKLLPLDCEGGTFTVSNLGMLGVDQFVAIINPPQCAIMAAGRVASRVVPYGDGTAVRSMMSMTLSADHRIVDGVIAARFLQRVKQILENK
jgi:pyruvate dehydrogenase E2 component (dihydrolipoamide acetyltransferase)